MPVRKSTGALYLLLKCAEVLTLSGTFWHITDQHLDPSYRLADDPERVCNSSGRRPALHAGKFGDYVCDSPFHLINSSVYAMKTILPDPDFIVWTGDDTPHVPNEDLLEPDVLRIISNLTQTINQVFPNTKVYSALGNHDYHPKSQLPGAQNQIYDQVAEMWGHWMEESSQSTFKTGGYYTEKLLNRTGFRMLVLNTNLYYDQNQQTQNQDDPAGQFLWADQVLQEAASNKEKVYIIGHVPPGFFEKKRNKPWFRPGFNKRYLEMIQKHHSVIMGQFFGHHHTDSFRMVYDTQNSPIGAMFLSPGVSPWQTTLPGVLDGANNPAIRVFEYDTHTLLVKDVVTYYLNLSRANAAQAGWEKEYRLTESFQVADASPGSMQAVLGLMATSPCHLQRYYQYNSVSYDLTLCQDACRTDQLCAVRELDFHRYQACLAEGAGVAAASSWVQVVCVAVWATAASWLG